MDVVKSKYPEFATLEVGGFGVPESLVRQAADNLRNPKLLDLIKEELGKRHFGDDDEKLFGYLYTRTAYLDNSTKRKSLALKGDSSVGKDNLMDTILYYSPPGSWIKLTRGTVPAIEDDTQDARILAYSEMNAGREDGANKDLVELSKQFAEGGVSVLKKDAASGFKTTKRTVREQKTVIYSTTEDAVDEELSTRLAVLTIRSDAAKIALVNNMSLERSASLLNVVMQEDSAALNWLSVAHTMLEVGNVVLPYNSLISGRAAAFFNCEEPRSQRDLKRLLALAEAIAWLFQKQRPIITSGGIKVVVSLPQDFIAALEVGEAFFNLSFLGLDGRANDLLDYLKGSLTEEVSTDAILKAFPFAKRTMWRRLNALAQRGYIEIISGQLKGQPSIIRVRQGCAKGVPYLRQKKELEEALVAFDINKWLESGTGLAQGCFTVSYPNNDDGAGGCAKNGESVTPPSPSAENSQEVSVSGHFGTPQNGTPPTTDAHAGFSHLPHEAGRAVRPAYDSKEGGKDA